MRTLFAFLLLCSPAYAIDLALARAYVAADFAFIPTGSTPAPQPKPTPTECTCGGTKKVVIQDGNNKRVVPCPCGDSCPCVGKKPHKEATGPSRGTRMLYIWSYGCRPCNHVSNVLFPELEKVGWKIGSESDHIQPLLWDDAEEIVNAAGVKTTPAFILLKDETIVATRELILPEMNFTSKIIAEFFISDGKKLSKPVSGMRPVGYQPNTYPTTFLVYGEYPTRSNNWDVNGDNHPSRRKLIKHLLEDPNHSGSFLRDYLESLSTRELRALHSDHHEGKFIYYIEDDPGFSTFARYGGQPQVFSRKAMKRRGRQSQYAEGRRYCPTCPRNS